MTSIDEKIIPSAYISLYLFTWYCLGHNFMTLHRGHSVSFKNFFFQDEPKSSETTYKGNSFKLS